MKMTVLNMFFHGIRCVFGYLNTFISIVFWCCQVTPFLYEYGGMPYVVPYGTDIEGALSMLPRGKTVEAPSVNTIDSDNQGNDNKNKGVLDAWL